MKKIIVINDYGFNSGGASVVAIQTAIGLKKLGIDVTFLCACAPIDKKLIESGLETVCLGQSNLRKNKSKIKAIFQGLWNRKASCALNKLLSSNQEKTVITLVHSYSKALSPSIFYVLKKRKIKTVLTLHDYFAACPNGGFLNYQTKRNCNLTPLSLKCIACNCDIDNYVFKLYRCLRQIVLRFCFSKSNTFYAYNVSENSQALMKPFIGNVFRTFGVLHNPIKLENIEFVDVFHNEKYIYIGRLSEEKGIQYFCKVIAELNLKGIVLGDGALKDSLKKQYPNIEFYGWVEGKDKQQYIKQAKCLIFPSCVRETFGLAVPEMLSQGIPCIVPTQCGATYLIKDGFNGYVFEMGNYASLKQAVLKMEKDEIGILSKNIKDSFDRKTFSLDVYLAKLVAIINSI